jgi:hypothetical protein
VRAVMGDAVHFLETRRHLRRRAAARDLMDESARAADEDRRRYNFACNKIVRTSPSARVTE